jgi:hypothetical protein
METRHENTIFLIETVLHTYTQFPSRCLANVTKKKMKQMLQNETSAADADAEEEEQKIQSIRSIQTH